MIQTKQQIAQHKANRYIANPLYKIYRTTPLYNKSLTRKLTVYRSKYKLQHAFYTKLMNLRKHRFGIFGLTVFDKYMKVSHRLVDKQGLLANTYPTAESVKRKSKRFNHRFLSSPK